MFSGVHTILVRNGMMAGGVHACEHARVLGCCSNHCMRLKEVVNFTPSPVVPALNWLSLESLKSVEQVFCLLTGSQSNWKELIHGPVYHSNGTRCWGRPPFTLEHRRSCTAGGDNQRGMYFNVLYVSQRVSERTVAGKEECKTIAEDYFKCMHQRFYGQL